MRLRLLNQLLAGGVLAAFCAQGAWAAGFVKLTKSSATVLTTCNPSNSASSTTCRVTSLPGEDNYDLTASRSTPILINDATVGTLYEKVWRSSVDSKFYIFGTRLVLTNHIWDESGTPFRVSDAFRRSLPNHAVSVAYYQNGALTALKLAGRTAQGLTEYSGSQPDRDNTWVDARVDVNGAGSSAAQQSPWLLVKAKASSGISTDPVAIRTLNSSTAEATELYLTGYLPNGLSTDDGDDD